MRIEELEHFLEIANCNNVTQAAASLHMAQPALSRSLERLEKDIGVRLFDRDGRRLRLNRYGEVLIPHAARVIAEIGDARRRLAALLNPDAGVISLSFVTSYGSWLVPKLVESYRQIVPDAHFILTGGPANNVVEAVRDGGADIGFLSPRPTASDLLWTELAQENLSLAVPVNHPFSTREHIIAADLRDLDFVALRPDFGLRQITDLYLSGLGIRPRIVMEATEISTLWALVAAGVGAAIMPTDRLPHDGIIQLPLSVSVKRPAGMIISAIRRLSPGAAQFAQFVDEEKDSVFLAP